MDKPKNKFVLYGIILLIILIALVLIIFKCNMKFNNMTPADSIDNNLNKNEILLNNKEPGIVEDNNKNNQIAKNEDAIIEGNKTTENINKEEINKKTAIPDEEKDAGSDNVIKEDRLNEDRTDAYIKNGWIKNSKNNHYYKLTGKLDFMEAENEAEKYGGYLTTINDREEELWIKEQFGGFEYFWIGFTDKEKEGEWKWLNGEMNYSSREIIKRQWKGLPVPYTNWWGGYPNNSYGPNQEPEDAAVINYGGRMQLEDGSYKGTYGDGWNDQPLHLKYRGIIESGEPVLIKY